MSAFLARKRPQGRISFPETYEVMVGDIAQAERVVMLSKADAMALLCSSVQLLLGEDLDVLVAAKALAEAHTARYEATRAANATDVCKACTHDELCPDCHQLIAAALATYEGIKDAADAYRKVRKP